MDTDLGFYVVIKHHDQATSGKRVCFSFQFYIMVRAEIQGRNLEAGTEAEAMEE